MVRMATVGWSQAITCNPSRRNSSASGCFFSRLEVSAFLVFGSGIERELDVVSDCYRI